MSKTDSDIRSELTGYYVGVDVGTGSARACIIDGTGTILATTSKDISKWEPKPGYFNQSSTEIWNNICYCVKTSVEESGIDPAKISGIGFDATCSLVVLNEHDDTPVAVGPDFSVSDQNILLWMDHRAGKQTRQINKTHNNLLKYVGGSMSIEMEIPKAKWLKENMPEGMFAESKFYDLADFLTHRATDAETRSFCSVICKQGYVPVGVDGSVKGWSKQFLESVGLEELAEDEFRRLGGVQNENGHYLSAGQRVGTLSKQAANELGLTTSCYVGSGVIDAYAGWIGTVAAKTTVHSELTHHPDDPDIATTRLAAVAGTSTCHLIMSKEPVFVPGVWGPYRDVLVPDRWLAEGGQSTTGQLLHFVLTTHPAYNDLVKASMLDGVSAFVWLNKRLEQLRVEKGLPSVLALTRYYFFYGDLYGNRSPIANPDMRGDIVGESMDVSLDALALKYLAAVEFIGQQTRHIIESLNKAGHNVQRIYLSGGQCRNDILTKIMATACNMEVIIPKYIDSAVVLGSAMLGAMACHDDLTLWQVMSKLSGPGRAVEPAPQDSYDAKLLNAKFEVFMDQTTRQQKYRKIVNDAVEELDD